MTDANGVTRIALNDGNGIPQLGFGVYQLPDAETPAIVGSALEAGYRSIDTAAIYGNEAGVGRALRETAIPRETIFVTTKLWNDRQGYDTTLTAFDESLARLGLETVDLYLIHWPCPQKDSYVDTWRALARLKQEGRARSIGVSNFTAEHLERAIAETGVTPAVNQIELHPHFQQRALREVHGRLGIVTEAWSPLGQAKALNDPVLTEIARRHGRGPAQIVLRWHIENGHVAIPKSATPSRIAENVAVFDFSLTPEDRAAIDGLDRSSGRIGPDPASFS
ncbi:aldo/keto reductase [Methylobacterium haplocladii]|uniref:Oxidoreductase n=1 Tax=Methylobacterium haplocladii TaxID=1176176 RepID=A0A512IMG7_9HYPH|nr:aldo/keto reductase [Methylobacterium haplocladii]GEO98916.1 oxidoreductase [Methylobacterium haplocladii]GJD85283.1 putative oxidoreductase/MSMEI_2347 [Methylobacterium haplocladii]GLS58094.1 oxidoreductase [Methylobacterium haplocladii]